MILPFDQLYRICIKLGCCFLGMIKARASGSNVYLYFIKKGRQARHRIPRNSCALKNMPIVPIEGNEKQSKHPPYQIWMQINDINR